MTRHVQKRIVSLFCLLFLLFSLPVFANDEAIIERVVDGDTLVVIYDGQQEKIRLIGVDTPEIVHPNRPVEYFGKEASGFTKKLLPPRTQVRLEFDWQMRDKYHRLLAYVYLKDGTFLNAEIIKQGYGHAYTKYPFKYLEEFREHEKQARERGLGLWGERDVKEEPQKARAPNEPSLEKKSLTETPAQQTKEETVYITRTGKKYHQESCSYLRKSKIPISKKEAIEGGYTPCSRCNP